MTVVKFPPFAPHLPLHSLYGKCLRDNWVLWLTRQLCFLNWHKFQYVVYKSEEHNCELSEPKAIYLRLSPPNSPLPLPTSSQYSARAINCAINFNYCYFARQSAHRIQTSSRPKTHINYLSEPKKNAEKMIVEKEGETRNMRHTNCDKFYVKVHEIIWRHIWALINFI